MKRIEIILIIGFVVALILKSLLIGPGDTIIVLTLNFLVIFYFVCTVPLLLDIPLNQIFSKAAYSGNSILRILGTVGIAYCMPIVTIGLMFRLLLLPGAGVMLGIGTTSLTIITIVALVKFLFKRDSNFYKQVLIRVIPMLILGFFFYQTPTNKQVAFFYRDNPEFVELYGKHYNDPANEQLKRKVHEALMEME